MVRKTKIKKRSQPGASSSEGSNPFAAAYAARLTRQVAQELNTPRPASTLRKKKTRRARS